MRGILKAPVLVQLWPLGAAGIVWPQPLGVTDVFADELASRRDAEPNEAPHLPRDAP
jgi:hypothetical protein